jgi:hypothetical protein
MKDKTDRYIKEKINKRGDINKNAKKIKEKV